MNPDLIDEMRRRVPFWRTLKAELLRMADGEAEFRVEFDPIHHQNGIMHGGVLASLIDSACACAAISRTFPDAYATSINLQVSYLKPVSKGVVRVVGKCLRAGDRVLFCEAHAWNDEGQLVGRGSSELLRIEREG